MCRQSVLEFFYSLVVLLSGFPNSEACNLMIKETSLVELKDMYV